MKIKTSFLKTAFALLSSSLFLLSPITPACFSLPVPEDVVNGSVEFSYPDAATLNINASDKAIINYQSFDIAQNESVIINLPSVNNEVLNRVLGDKASEISGRLTCNGIFILVNKNGIYFGPQAQVDVASMIASTRDITNSDFLESKYIFGKLSENQLYTLLRNQGNISIRREGFGVLIAGAVENSGTIIAPVGTIALAGGDMVTLDIAGDGLISVAIDKPTAAKVYDLDGNPITDQLKNTGTLQADGGVVLLKAEALPGLFEHAINLEGYVRADKLEGKDGQVKIISSGKVVINAQVNATKVIVGSADEGIPSSIEMNSGVLTGDSVSVVAGKISINSTALLTEVHKTGDLSLTSSALLDDLITLEGEDIKVTYLKTNNITLQADNNINTTPGLIIQANQVRLMANRFGTAELPLNIQANSTYIQRLSGEIAILESVGIGTSIMLRGPPDGFGAIIYPQDTSLTLEASKVVLSSTTPTYLYGDITFYNFECKIPDKEIYFEAGKTYTFKGTLEITGLPDIGPEEYHIKLRSSQPGTQWYLDIQSQDYTIDKVFLQDAYSLNYLFIPSGVDLGNNVNIEIDPTWDGGGADNNWSTAANWSGNVVPATTDAVTFDGTSTKNCTIDNVGTWSAGDLTITSAYTGTITQSVALTIKNFSQAGGTFTGGAAGIIQSLNGSFSLSGGIFTSTSGRLTIKNTFTISGGTFNHNSGEVRFQGRNTFTVTTNGATFYDVTFARGGGTTVETITLADSFTVAGTLVVQNDTDYDYNVIGSNNPTITVSGNMSFDATASNTGAVYFGNATNNFTVNLTGNFTIADTQAYMRANLTLAGTRTITQTAGTINTGTWTITSDLRTLASAVTIGGNLTINSGGSFDTNGYALTVSGTFSNSGELDIRSSETITLTMDTDSGTVKYLKIGSSTGLNAGNSYYHLYFLNSGTYTLNANLDVNGDLNIISGATLDVSASNYQINVGGNWVGGTFIARSGTVVFDKDGAGTQTLNAGSSSFYRITHSGTGTLQLSTNTLVVTNYFTNSAGYFDLNGVNWTMTGATFSNDASVYLKGSETITGFTNDTDSGAVYYTGSGSITGLKAGNSYYNLLFAGSGTFTLNAALDINNNLYAGSVGGGSLVCGAYAVNIGGNLTGNTLTTSGTVTFDATTTGKTISTNVSFNNLTFDGIDGGWSLSGPLDINGDLTITNGTLDLNGYSIDLAGAFTNMDTLKLIGSETLTGFTNDVDNGGTVEYYGTSSYTGLKAGNNYCNLTFSGSGTFTLNAALDVDNNLSISSGTLACGANSVNIGGNFSCTGGSFTSSGTTTFDATINDKTITSGGISFNNLTFDGVSGGWTLQDALDVNGNLTITNGTLSLNGYSLDLAGTFSNLGTLQLKGSETLTGFTNDTDSGTIQYAGTGSYTGLKAGNSYYNLYIATGNYTLNAALDVNNNLTIVAGSLNCGAYSVNIGGSFGQAGGITSSGTVTFDATATGKTIISLGSSFNNLVFDGVGGGWSLSDAMDVNGNLTITNGTLSLNGQSLDLAGTFSNSATLKLVGSETLTGFTNDTDSGTIEYYGTGTYTGLKAGNNYNNLTFSGSGGTYTLNAALDVNNNLTVSAGTLACGAYAVNIGGNFSNSSSFTTTGTVNFDGASTQTLNPGSSSFYGLTISNSSSNGVQISTNNLTVTNSLTISSSGVLDLAGRNLTATGASFSNSGTLKLIGSETLTGFSNDTDSGTIEYYGTGSYTGLKAGNNYNNLTFSGSGGTYTLNAALDVNNDLTITNGTLACGSNSVNIGGNFSRTGGSFTSSGTTTFDATTTGINITSGGVSFNNLTFDGSGGGWTLQDALDVDNDLTISNGTLACGANAVNIGGNFSRTAGTFTTSGTVTFDKASGTQTLNSGGANFYNLEHSGAGILQLLTNNLVVTGTFTNSSGTFDANGLTNTVTGLATVSGGEYQAKTATQTFNGGLTISGGTFTGSTGSVDVNGDLTLSSGTLTAPSGSFTIAGSFSRTAGTFTAGSNTVTFDATTTGKTITSGGISFYNLIFDGSGGGWTLQDVLDVDNDLTISNGTFSVSSYTLTIGGDFTVNATFTPSTGKVVFDDAGKVSHVYGTTFSDFECTTAGKEIQFEAGSTETITGNLTITGAAGNLIKLRSTTTGIQWKINPQGAINVSYVDVQDSNNLNGTTISPTGSIDSGNNNYWFVTITEPEVEEATHETDTSTPPVKTITPTEPGPETEISPDDNIDLGGDEEVAEPQPEEATEAVSEGKEYGFDYSSLDKERDEDQKYKKKYYVSGKYKTVVIVIEGRVVVAPYDERGVDYKKAKSLLVGQKAAQVGEVK